MELSYIIQQLQSNRSTFESLLKYIDPDQYLWKQTPDKWCLLEVVCHLYDEEREDFRARVRHLLDHPSEPLPPIDPQGWVKERNYIDKDYKQMVKNFLDERDYSVQWLNSLSNPSWNNTYEHPRLGTVTAEYFLVNWLAHDYLHFRQITRLKYDYLGNVSNTHLAYAGGW